MTDLLSRTWEGSLLSLARLQNRALEKNHLMLITALLAVWALDLGALAFFLIKYHAPAAYSLAGAVLAILGALLELGRRGRVRIAWGVLLPLALVHLAFLSAAAWLAAGSGRGSVIENYALYQVDPFPDGTARFAALSKLPDGQTFLSPIDALILLKLRNGAGQPKVIRDYKIEAWTDSGWQSLCQVPFAPHPPYYLFTPARAREIVLTPLALKGPENPIAAGKASLFWSAWSCPQKCDLAAAPLRLKTIDRDAREENILFPSNRKPDGAALPSGLDIAGVVDLDATKERLYGRKSCASQTGVRRHAHTLW